MYRVILNIVYKSGAKATYYSHTTTKAKAEKGANDIRVYSRSVFQNPNYKGSIDCGFAVICINDVAGIDIQIVKEDEFSR